MSSETGKGLSHMTAAEQQPAATKLVAGASMQESSVIELSTDAGILKHLSRQAKEELQTKLSELSVVVLKEAHSLEGGDRASGAEPDISRSHVQEAWYVTRIS